MIVKAEAANRFFLIENPYGAQTTLCPWCGELAHISLTLITLMCQYAKRREKRTGIVKRLEKCSYCNRTFLMCVDLKTLYTQTKGLRLIEDKEET